MSPDITDEELVVLAQKGDKRAFELLVRKYQHKIVQLVSRLVGDGDAPDVAQETLIKAWRALKGFQGNSAFYTWLYRIGINTAKNHLVSRGRRPSNQDIDMADAEQFGHTEHLSDIDTPESLLLSDEIKQKVGEVIAKLPPDLRQAIVLRELEGKSYEEIADITAMCEAIAAQAPYDVEDDVITFLRSRYRYDIKPDLQRFQIGRAHV